LVNFLVSKDDDRAEDPKEALDTAIENAFRKALMLAAKGYTERRGKDLIGDDGQAIRREISGENLRAVDVTIVRDTSLPKSAAERMDLATAVLEKNASKEPVEMMFAIMQAETVEDLKAILQGNSQAEETYARMENYDMRKGIPRPAAIGENHQMHIKIHEELMRDPNTSQETKMLNLTHQQMHDRLAGQEAATRGAAVMEGQAPASGEPQEGGEMPPTAAPQAAVAEAAPMQEAGVVPPM
jgi:rubrerythrin